MAFVLPDEAAGKELKERLEQHEADRLPDPELRDGTESGIRPSRKKVAMVLSSFSDAFWRVRLARRLPL
jgi:hypothetical protein